jgi:hypothetical protein
MAACGLVDELFQLCGALGSPGAGGDRPELFAVVTALRSRTALERRVRLRSYSAPPWSSP